MLKRTVGSRHNLIFQLWWVHSQHLKGALTLFSHIASHCILRHWRCYLQLLQVGHTGDGQGLCLLGFFLNYQNNMIFTGIWTKGFAMSIFSLVEGQILYVLGIMTGISALEPLSLACKWNMNALPGISAKASEIWFEDYAVCLLPAQHWLTWTCSQKVGRYNMICVQNSWPAKC